MQFLDKKTFLLIDMGLNRKLYSLRNYIDWLFNLVKDNFKV